MLFLGVLFTMSKLGISSSPIVVLMSLSWRTQIACLLFEIFQLGSICILPSVAARPLCFLFLLN